MSARRLSLYVALAALPSAALAQTQTFDPSEGAGQGAALLRTQSELAQWQQRHGDNWRIVTDSETGHARFLFGGSRAALFTPKSDADYFALARSVLTETAMLTGIEPGTLVEDSVTFLPLRNAGSTDKMSVQFRQQVGGTRVLGGTANVLFDLSGRVLSVDTTGMPHMGAFSVKPALDASDAVDAALGLFAAETGLAPSSIGTPELVIDQVVKQKQRSAVLAWQVDVQNTEAGSEPVGWIYRIDAVHGGQTSKVKSVHSFDVSGTVRSMATPGQFPDSATNPEVQTPMPYLRVTSAQGNATTDVNGNFVIVGATAPLSVTVTYDGTYCQTNNQVPPDYTLSTTLNAASGNSILMNPASAALTTAEANGLNWIGLLRSWTRTVNPADAMADFLATSNVNIASTCNAFYNGSSVNFYQAGGGCVNTAFSSVVVHEMGHWLNDRYSSGNGSDGFGEGNADNFATHISDDPIVGHDFCGVGCNVRDGNNLRQFCGDSNGGCYGEVHADGEVLMGALWKVRTQLKSSLGQAAGVLASNTLFNSWMNAYNDTQIKTIIETHYLTLDDNDGNINNGTPNYVAIDQGFRTQGFPGFNLTFVAFSGVTQLGNTTDEAGPYVVNATIAATFNPPVVNPRLNWRVGGSGSYTQVPMSLVSGSNYTASIPGHVSPAKVEYYLSASDSQAHTDNFPQGGSASPLKFFIGIVTSFYKDDFETGAPGWTHGSPNGSQDDWMLSSQVGANISFGKAGDPTTPAVSGNNVWGNDLGPSGFNGFYSDNVSNYLRSPIIDCTGATGSTLLFKRWLGVESGQFDKATVKVNGVQVYINPTSTDLVDSSWQDMEIDISSVADNNASVQIEFGMVSDVAVNFGGWNIDDVEIVSVQSSCGTPTSYCTAKTTSAFTVPNVGFTGTASLSANNFSVTLTGALPNVNTIPLWGPTQGNTPFFGGTLCLTPPFIRGPQQVTTAGSTATISVPITAAMVGTTRNFQWWFRDISDSFGVGVSNGLKVTFCN